MNHTRIVLFLTILVSFFYISSNSLHDVELKHHKVKVEFFRLLNQMKLNNCIELQGLFRIANESDPLYLKALRSDIAFLKKTIKRKKKHKEFFDTENVLCIALEKIYKFLKKYYLELDVVNFLDQVHDEWGDIIQAVDKGQDILPFLTSKGIYKPGIKGLKVFINRMNRLLDKVEDYENRVHSDFIDLKLSNYVLKIELIRIRNAAIFHPLYRGTPIVTYYPR